MVRPSQGRPLTTWEVAVRAPAQMSPTPTLLPTFSQYWSAPTAGFHENETEELNSVEPGVGVSSTAGPTSATVPIIWVADESSLTLSYAYAVAKMVPVKAGLNVTETATV